MEQESSFSNHLLVAMPSLNELPFKQTVIYVCEHHVQGAVGLIINQPMPYELGMVFDQLEIQAAQHEQTRLPLLYGGPIQPERGFVIHRPFGQWSSSLALRDDVTVTTSNDIIRAIAQNHGPKDILVTLGYVGWGENQLNQEIIDNFWLVCPTTPELLYEVPFKERWAYAAQSIGVDMNRLISGSGHA